MADVIVDQRLFGVLDRALDGLQLLSDLRAWPAPFDHLDDLLQMAVSTFEPPDNFWMIAVIMAMSYPRGRIANILPRGCTLTVDFDDCEV